MLPRKNFDIQVLRMVISCILKDNINDPFFSYFKHELLLNIYSNWDQ